MKIYLKIGERVVVMTDNINSPNHYNSGDIETIDYIQDKLTAEQFEGYLAGNVMKYVSRYRHKNGIEDLKKARWHRVRLIEGAREEKTVVGMCAERGVSFFTSVAARVCAECKEDGGQHINQQQARK